MQSIQTHSCQMVEQACRLVRVVSGGNELFKNGEIYLLQNGLRRKFLSMRDFNSYGFALESIVEADLEELLSIPLGGYIPYNWTFRDWCEPSRNSVREVREIMLSRLTGQGCEFGAGPKPLPVPIDTGVVFADPFPMSLQKERMFVGSQTFVTNTLTDSFDQMNSLKDDSLDFILGSHVIEHTRNPLAVFERSYRVLRQGGWLCLVVPDIRYTFDRTREITSLDHLIEDWHSPSSSRDFEHYLDFYRNAARSQNPELEARRAYDQGLDIHFHTWDFASFYEMVIWARAIFPFSEIWAQPPVRDDKNGIEFYFCLRK